MQYNCYSFVVKQTGQAAIVIEMAKIWRAIANDVLPLTAEGVWDHLLIDVRGIDGGVSIYPQHSEKPPFRVAWARLDLHQLAREFEALQESELEEGTKPSEINRSYAAMLVEAAKEVGLSDILRGSRRLTLRFVSYSEDQTQPFLEVAV